MAVASPFLSVIKYIWIKLLNQKHILADWIKNRIQLSTVYKTLFRSKYTHRLKMKRWKIIRQANDNQKTAEVAILLLDTIDF